MGVSLISPIFFFDRCLASSDSPQIQWGDEYRLAFIAEKSNEFLFLNSEARYKTFFVYVGSRSENFSILGGLSLKPSFAVFNLSPGSFLFLL